MRVVVVILAIFSALARGSDLEACRRMLAHVVVERGAMSADDLRDFAAQPDGTNPIAFASFAKPLVAHAFREAFAVHLGQPGVGEALRTEALRLAEIKSHHAIRREQTQTAALAIASPIKIRDLRGDIGEPTVFQFGGKSYAAYRSRGNDLTVFDFATQEERVVTPFGIYSDSPIFFEAHGEGWFLTGADNDAHTFRLDGQRGNHIPDNGRRITRRTVLDVNGKYHLAIYSEQLSQLLVIPAENPQAATIVPLKERPIRLHAAGPVLHILTDQMTTYAYDAASGKLEPSQRAHAMAAAPPAVTPPKETTGFVYFSHGGKDYLSWGMFEGSLSIVDIKHPELVVRQPTGKLAPKIILPFATADGVNAIIKDDARQPGALFQLVGPPITGR